MEPGKQIKRTRRGVEWGKKKKKKKEKTDKVKVKDKRPVTQNETLQVNESWRSTLSDVQLVFPKVRLLKTPNSWPMDGDSGRRRHSYLTSRALDKTQDGAQCWDRSGPRHNGGGCSGLQSLCERCAVNEIVQQMEMNPRRTRVNTKHVWASEQNDNLRVLSGSIYLININSPPRTASSLAFAHRRANRWLRCLCWALCSHVMALEKSSGQSVYHLPSVINVKIFASPCPRLRIWQFFTHGSKNSPFLNQPPLPLCNSTYKLFFIQWVTVNLSGRVGREWRCYHLFMCTFERDSLYLYIQQQVASARHWSVLAAEYCFSPAKMLFIT